MLTDVVEFIKNKKTNLIIGAVIIVLLLVYYGYKDQGGLVSEKDDPLSKGVETTTSDNINDMVIVHISGEVHEPGIVELRHGQRLYEALELAGGTTTEADLDKVNLALILEDQQKIVVPAKLEQGGVATAAPEDDKVNINTADVQELTTLPGIGPTIAQSIVDYRDDNNGFINIDQIKEVPRIGDRTFEKLKEKITCY